MTGANQRRDVLRLRGGESSPLPITMTPVRIAIALRMACGSLSDPATGTGEGAAEASGLVNVAN